MSSLTSEASMGAREQPLERSIGGSVVAVLECPYRYTPLKKLFPHSHISLPVKRLWEQVKNKRQGDIEDWTRPQHYGNRVQQ